MRGPDARLLRLTPEPAPKTPKALSAANVTEKDNLVFRLGMYGTKLTPTVASTLGGLRGDSGVLVLALAGAGMAEQMRFSPRRNPRGERQAGGLGRVSAGQPRSDSGRRATRSPDRTRGHAVLYRSRRHAWRRAAPQEDRIPYACPRRHTAPAPVFLFEDRQASCCLSGQSLRRPFATDTERCIQDGGEGNQPADL